MGRAYESGWTASGAAAGVRSEPDSVRFRSANPDGASGGGVAATRTRVPASSGAEVVRLMFERMEGVIGLPGSVRPATARLRDEGSNAREARSGGCRPRVEAYFQRRRLGNAWKSVRQR